MRCLSVLQPWASLIATGAKRIETRSWCTRYRGPLAIHASKTFPKYAKDIVHGDAIFQHALQEALDVDASPSQIIGMLPLGAVVATCRLADCLTIAKPGTSYPNPKAVMYPPGGREEHFGNYCPLRYAWVLEDVCMLSIPVPAVGALSLWEWDVE